MKRVKVVLDFQKFPIAEKIEFGKNVITKLTGNTQFPNPDVPPAQQTSAVSLLETDYTAALGGGRALIAKMHQSEKAFDDVFRKMAMFVERVSNGNEALILSSGFHVSKQPTPKNIIDFKVDAGKEHGEILLNRKAILGAKAYLWQCSKNVLPSENNGWEYCGFSTQSAFRLSSLESASKIWFRVAGLTKDGLTEWSEPIMKVIP
jgi:hypothetical protein